MVSKAPTEKQPVDKGAILLSSIFFQKPVNGFHDIPAAYLHERAEKREFPSFYGYGGVSAACIYGDFVFDIMLQSFIMTYYEDLDLDQFESVLPDFRRRVIREFIYDIHPDRVDETESYISHNSISVFLKTVAENKIRDDMVIREVSQVIYTYMVGSDPRREGEEIQILPTEVIDADFEEQERAARLKRIDPKYEKNVKSIDLKMLKRLLCDDEGNSFDPKGWQKDMLTNLRRFNFVAASRRAGKCQWRGEEIRLYDGTYKKAIDILPGDTILSSDKMFANIVKNKTIYEKDVYKVTLDNGMSIRITGDHHMPTQHTYKNGARDLDIMNYKQAINLTNKDFIPVCLDFESEANKGRDISEINIAKAKLFGYSLGDGCSGNNTISCANDMVASKLFEICKIIGYNSSYNQDTSTFRISMGENKVHLKEQYPEIDVMAKDKYIPNYVYGWSKKEKWALLQGYIETDGCIMVKQSGVGVDGYTRKNMPMLEISSISEKLIDGVLRLFYDVGVIAYKRHHKKKTNFSKGYEIDIYYLHVRNKDSLKLIVDNCDISAKKNYSFFVDTVNNQNTDFTSAKIGLLPFEAYSYRHVIGKRKNNYSRSVGYGDSNVTAPSNDFQRWKGKEFGLDNWLRYSWHRVVSVEYIGVDKVVDIEVGGDHLYWVGNILSHNTLLSCYLASRQLMIPDQNIIFVVPELRSHGRVPWKYLLKMMGKNPNIRFDKSDRTIKNRENNSEIIFFSGAREDSVRGSAANLLVFDEAAYLSEMVYESASALVRTTNGIVYAITTPNIDTPKNRFYYKLIDAEIARFDIGSEKYGVRITLRENPFIPDKEKELIYKDGQTNLKIFNCEYMAGFAEGREFDLSRFWIIDYKPVEIMVGGAWLTNVRYEAFAKEVSINPYKHFIISYDCAKKKDRPGISLLGLRQGGADLVLADYMQNIDYVDQVRLILELRKMLGENRVSIVIDYNGVGIAVEELFRRTHNVPVIGIQTTSNREAIRVGAVWQVNKDQVMGKLKSAMGRDVIKGYSFQHNLRLEFETYDDAQSRNYGHHYDILMSLAYGVWVADKYGYMNAYVYGAEDRTNDFLVDGLSEETDYSDQLFPTQERNEWEREDKYGY